MTVNYNTSIITEGLRLCYDNVNPKSYTSGTTVKDLITLTSGTNGLANSAVSWMNAGVYVLTLSVIIKKLTTNTAYATNPLTKYNVTTDNTFSLYTFGTNSGTAPEADGRVLLYSNRGGVWGGVGNSYVMSVGETAWFTWQYNSGTGGQLWVNGVKSGARSGSGIFGSASNNSNLILHSPLATSILTLYYASIYDRELTDAEVFKNFNAHRGRYGL